MNGLPWERKGPLLPFLGVLFWSGTHPSLSLSDLGNVKSRVFWFVLKTQQESSKTYNIYIYIYIYIMHSNKTENKSHRSISGVATGVARGAECHPWQRKICQKSEKRGKKSGKFGKKEENWEEKAKIREVLSLCPSWQIGLATLLRSISRYG